MIKARHWAIASSCWVFAWLLVAANKIAAFDLSREFDSQGSREEDEGDENGPSGPTNLLFITADQMRFDALGFVQRRKRDYMNYTHIRTPNIDALAENGIHFEIAYCTSPSCGPSRTSVKTGCTVQRNGVLDSKLTKEKFIQRMDMIESKIHNVISFEQILVEKVRLDFRYGPASVVVSFKRGYIAESYGEWAVPERMYYESNATSRSQGARVIRYNGYNDDGDPIFREATEVRKTYRKALRNLVKRGRVKLVYRKGSQRNAVSGLPYTPIRLDARYGYKKRTRLEKSYGFESWQLGETNVCGVSNVPSDCSATSMIGGMALDALKRLSRQARSQPFLLSVHFNAPHPPMVASPEYFEYYYKERRRLFVSPSITDNVRNSAYQESNKRKLIAKLGESYPYNDPGKIRELTSSYYAMIEEVDTWVGQFLRVLDRTGLRRNTMVVFTSDHGEMMGAHGMMNKAILLEEAARVPLIISSAGKLRKNVTIAEPVSHLDVHSTILDYLGAEEYDASDGTSLRRFIKQTSSNVEYDERFVVVEIDERFPVNDHQFSRSIGEVPNFMIRKGDYKLIITKQASSPILDMMYNLEADPYEMNNLLVGKPGASLSPKRIGKAEHLKALLIEWMTRMNGPEQFYSNPLYNLNEGLGDIEEIRRRRTWGAVDYWESDDSLSFGTLAKTSSGGYIRHEYFYAGKSDPSGAPLRIWGIHVVGKQSEHFSVDKTADQVNDGYIRIRVSLTLSKPRRLADVDASLEFITSSKGKRTIPIILE